MTQLFKRLVDEDGATEHPAGVRAGVASMRGSVQPCFDGEGAGFIDGES